MSVSLKDYIIIKKSIEVNFTEICLEDEGVRTADALASIREAARRRLQRLDLKEESDTFDEEAAISLDTIPASEF